MDGLKTFSVKPIDPERAALIRNICLNPGDDLPRLVYADWLEERVKSMERDHAALIRLQCAYRNLVWENRRDAEQGKLDCEVDAVRDFLRLASRSMWVKAFLSKPDWTVSRGFVSGISCTLDVFAGVPCRCRKGQIYIDGRNPNPIVQAHEMDVCPRCKGTGFRIPGIAESTFREQPVETVDITDISFSSRDGRNWMVEQPSPVLIDPKKLVMHRSESLARQAYSNELVAYGRSLAYPEPAPANGQ